MKKLFYIFLSAAIALSISACGADDAATAKAYNIDSLIAESKKETNVDGSYYIRDYDENGMELRSSWYSADTALEEYTVYQYDDNGNMILRTLYGADNTMERYTE